MHPVANARRIFGLCVLCLAVQTMFGIFYSTCGFSSFASQIEDIRKIFMVTASYPKKMLLIALIFCKSDSDIFYLTRQLAAKKNMVPTTLAAKPSHLFGLPKLASLQKSGFRSREG